MCGIVGYVGDKQARDVVIEGLRRLEYRGYDSAGIALVDATASDRLATSAPASWPTSRRPSRRRPLPPSTTGIGHTRWATHGAPNDVNAHPHLGAARPGRASCTTASSRTSPGCATSSSATATTCVSETDTEVAAHLLELARRGDRRPDHRDAGGLPPARGRVHPRGGRRAGPRPAWWPRAATRPLVVGLGEGENFLGSDVAAFIEHTREALELGQDQVVTITRDDVRVTDFDGDAGARAGSYHVDWDLSAAEKDGFDWFMRKEIFEQPRAVARRAARPARRRRAAAARRGADHRGRAARRRQDRDHRLRHGQLRRPGREVRHRALDPDPVRGRARPRVPLPRPDPDPQHPRRRDQPVRRDRRHPDGDPLRARSSAPRCWRSATPTARRSRASPTR